MKRSRWLLFFQTGGGIPVFVLMQCKFSIFSTYIIKRNNVFLLDEESPAVFVCPTVGNRLTSKRTEPFRGRSRTLCKEFFKYKLVAARFYLGNDVHQIK